MFFLLFIRSNMGKKVCMEVDYTKWTIPLLNRTSTFPSSPLCCKVGSLKTTFPRLPSKFLQREALDVVWETQVRRKSRCSSLTLAGIIGEWADSRWDISRGFRESSCKSHFGAAVGFRVISELLHLLKASSSSLWPSTDPYLSLPTILQAHYSVLNPFLPKFCFPDWSRNKLNGQKC